MGTRFPLASRRWSSARVLLAAILGVLFLVCPPTLAENWPGWRGDGMGISPETDVLHEWGPGENLAWATEIGGDGISSPIVWGDRVIVTTAVERDTFLIHVVAAVIAFGLVGFALLSAALARRGRVGDAASGGAVAPWWCRVVLRLDRAAAVTWTSIFLVGLGAALFWRDELIKPFQEHIGWLTVRNITLFGLIAGLLWIDIRSWWRLAAGLLLVIALGVLYPLTPLDTYTLPLGPAVILSKRVLAPIAAAIAWSLLALVIMRRVPANEPESSGSLAWRGLGPLVVLLLAAVVYAWNPLELPELRLVCAAVSALAAVLWLLGSSPRHRPAPAPDRPTAWRALGPIAIVTTSLLMFVHVNYVQSWSSWQRRVVCLDRDTGDVRWSTVGFSAQGGRKFPLNSYATPTPVTDGRLVVADFGPGLVCMDLEGSVRWRALEAKFADFLRYGASSSPVLFDGSVIHTFMAERSQAGMEIPEFEMQSYIRALDIETGEELWRVHPPGAYHCYGTPLVTQVGDQPMLLFATYTHAVAYDPRNGDELWTLEIPNRVMIPSLVADESAVYVVGGSHRTGAAVAIPLASDGSLARSEFDWEIESDNIPETSSPLLYDGLLYWISIEGVGVCFDPATGTQVWKHRIDGEYDASPIACDGKIYFTSKTGEVTVVRAGRRFEQLARNTIGPDERLLSSPAVSSGRIFFRTRTRVLCVGADTP